jgi:cytochrome c oxidase subunit 2
MPFRPVFDQVLTIWAAVAGVVFALVCAILLVAIARNRAKRRDTLPIKRSENTPLEAGYVVVLGGIVAALVTGSLLANAKLNNGVGLSEAEAKAAAGPAETVAEIDVTGFRWCWEFDYEAAPVTVTGECRGGDFPTIVVPAGQPVEFNLSSDDVLHSFWLPDFAVKRDAFPHHVNTLRMVFPEEGKWRGRCSEFCGTYHVTMDFYVRAVSPAEYEQFLQTGELTV